MPTATDPTSRLSAVWSAAVSPVVSTVVATAGQLTRWRIAVIVAAAAAALVTVAVFVPVPTAVQLRDWVAAAGPWFPVAFLGAHVLVTIAPFPRTVFTLAAGLLFGWWLGITLAVVASTLSAVLALWLVRATGWQVTRLVSDPRIEALDTRLRQRGWAAVLALRLIPAVPFSVINYAAGASGVRAWPYTVATVLGLLPGTTALVILGDAFTGNVSPLLGLVSLAIAAVGVSLLVYEVRSHRRHRAALLP